MSTIETATGCRITVGPKGLALWDRSAHLVGYELSTPLTPDERRRLADALDPERDFSGVDWKTMFEHEIRNRIAAVALLRRERDEALRKKGEMVDRAVRAEQELGELRSKVNAWGRERTAPAVSHAEIEEQLRIAYESGNHPIQRIRIATDAVCDLFGVEAEQAVDRVEELTDNLADILYGDELVTDQMRGVLERVVRAGMLFPEQEADQ